MLYLCGCVRVRERVKLCELEKPYPLRRGEGARRLSNGRFRLGGRDSVDLRRGAMHSSAPMSAPFGDLEAPGALLGAAAQLARTVGTQRELILMATGPDATSIAMTNNSLVTLSALGLRRHVLLLTDSWTTCEMLSRPPGMCFWSSRMLHLRPADSLTLRQFWDYRFRFYYIKKKYMYRLVEGGFSVLQADTDTVWLHDPFRMLREMKTTSIICMRDTGLANAGIIYARPGSRAALQLLDEVAWRVQLFQNHPEIVGRIVAFSKPPYYANSDDQTLLNDAIVGAVIGNRTFLGSTARFEARNRYHPNAPEWAAQPESKTERAELRLLWRSQKGASTTVPWGETSGTMQTGRRVRYITLPFKYGDGDGLALAPRALFAHMPFTPTAAITHLTAARGFNAKVSALRRIKMWNPLGSQLDSPEQLLEGGGDSNSAASNASGAREADGPTPPAPASSHRHIGEGRGAGGRGGKGGGGGGGGRGSASKGVGRGGGGGRGAHGAGAHFADGLLHRGGGHGLKNKAEGGGHGGGHGGGGKAKKQKESTGHEHDDVTLPKVQDVQPDDPPA